MAKNIEYAQIRIVFENLRDLADFLIVKGINLGAVSWIVDGKLLETFFNALDFWLLNHDWFGFLLDRMGEGSTNLGAIIRRSITAAQPKTVGECELERIVWEQTLV